VEPTRTPGGEGAAITGPEGDAMPDDVPKAGELDSLMLPQGGKSEAPTKTPAAP
jgi:hypothetical protein